MKRSACCKSELVYLTDGNFKLNRRYIEIEAICELIKNKKNANEFDLECGICGKKCELTERPVFTNEQIDWICYQIGDWYIEWRHKIANYEEKTHNLGLAKEGLKTMICGDHSNEENT